VAQALRGYYYCSCCGVSCSRADSLSSPPCLAKKHQVDGAIQVKSYLAGNPPIKIKLNDDLLIAKRDNPYGSGGFGGGARLTALLSFCRSPGARYL
jgi:hypothetical protein